MKQALAVLRFLRDGDDTRWHDSAFVVRHDPVLRLVAMGSRRTHLERQRRLLEAGGPPADIARVIGPVGLIKATRDPPTLALSIMAQVVQAYEVAMASANDNPAMSAVKHSHDPIEYLAGAKTDAGALHATRIIDRDQTLIADARFGQEEDKAHGQHI